MFCFFLWTHIKPRSSINSEAQSASLGAESIHFVKLFWYLLLHRGSTVRDTVRDYTPEWAEGITGVPAGDVAVAGPGSHVGLTVDVVSSPT